MHLAGTMASAPATVLLLPTAALGQVLEVPGDFDSLQDALDAAPDGAVVMVHGGVWGSITITKPVSLLGAPAPRLSGSTDGSLAPIVLQGAGSGEVTLSRVRAGAIVNDSLAPSRLAPAIQGGGFEELHVYDSDIIALERSFFSGLGYGNSAIDTDIPFVVVERSTVKGSRTDIDDACTGNPSSWIPPAGIDAPGTVVVLDSFVAGGAMGRFQYSGWPTPADCDPGNCPPFPGAPGVACSTLYHSGSLIVGGQGARWSTCSPAEYCCESPGGPPFVVAQENPLADDLSADGPPHLGRDYVLHLGTPGPMASLLMASGIDPPVTVPVGVRFLEPGSTVLVGTVSTPGTARLHVPLDPSLLGQTMAFQLLDPNTGLSRPAAGAVQPPTFERANPPSVTVTRSL